LKEAAMLTKNAFAPLMDASLSAEDVNVIKSVLQSCESKFVDFHDLRTRKSGKIRYIDFHITMCKDTSIEEANKITKEVEADIKTKIPFCSVLIHLDPCADDANPKCPVKRKS
jgi:divalent metal cation (Fe/Co/Zn/Cd) transporter